MKKTLLAATLTASLILPTGGAVAADYETNTEDTDSVETEAVETKAVAPAATYKKRIVLSVVSLAEIALAGYYMLSGQEKVKPLNPTEPTTESTTGHTTGHTGTTTGHTGTTTDHTTGHTTEPTTAHTNEPPRACQTTDRCETAEKQTRQEPIHKGHI